MNIEFVNSDKRLYRGKIYINKDKYSPTDLEMKFLKSFGITIKIGSFSLKNNAVIYLEWYNSPNEVSNFYKPLFDFIEFKNGYIKLDDVVIGQISRLDTSVLKLLLFNTEYNKFIIEKTQNVLMSCIKGFNYEIEMYESLFYVTNEIKTTYFSKLEIIYILNKNI